jgi:hypothetical protein
VRIYGGLTIQKKSTQRRGETESYDDRRLYWAINLLDHIICFATGRPLTTRREYVDVELPAEILVQREPFELASPFPSMIRVIQIQGLVNAEIGMLPEQSLDLTAETRRRMLQYGNDLVAHYAAMHPSLAFDVSNFRAHAIKGQGGTFLLLHLWFNSVRLHSYSLLPTSNKIDTAVSIGHYLSPPPWPPIWAKKPPRYKLSLSLKPANLALDSANH